MTFSCVNYSSCRNTTTLIVAVVSWTFFRQRVLCVEIAALVTGVVSVLMVFQDDLVFLTQNLEDNNTTKIFQTNYSSQRTPYLGDVNCNRPEQVSEIPETVVGVLLTVTSAFLEAGDWFDF